MKRIFFYSLIFSSLNISAQESSNHIYKKSSESFSSFNQSFKRDSVLSFRSRKGYFPTLIHNLGYQATFPLRMKGKDFFILGGTAVITLSLIHFDEEIDDFFKPIKNDNEFVEDVSPQVTELGDYYGYILLAGYGCYTIGFHKYKGFRTALLASQAAISAGLWMRVFKTLSGRMRPSVTYTDPEYHSDHWFGPFAQFDDEVSQNRSIAAFDAFPSGHTGAAFAMATVFAEQYKEYKAVPIIFYSAASIVGVTRMIEHEHWASDVFLGGVIGYFCGKQIIANEHRLFPEYKMAVKKSYSYFTPFSSAGFYGIEWRMVF